ncbi:PAS domain-containing protein [filamentous cyanobacterium LEGE 11480]|uniref:histidine kinase n=1 Tax=Romeriopsis navalis LEGE 11480 TaxID=2777977 RepID=A0A928VNX0_9CYAN|nr:ATP-binding protein [Romeriopsis navalis]MBE9029349.1 PAS domain-containing protein [Romeriopsis navalis LEGE 11480]
MNHSNDPRPVNGANVNLPGLSDADHHELQELRTLRQAYQAELKQRKNVEQKLRQAQRLLQLVMDTLPEAIFWKDQDSVYLGCNQKFARDAGLAQPEDIIGKTDYEMPWKTEEADFYRACDQRVIATQTAELGIIEPQLNSEGEQTWLETNKAPLSDLDGNIIGLLGTYQDVTPRKEAEIKRQELNQRLQQQTIELNATVEQLQQSQVELVKREKTSALGNLVAGIAHEINNPIGFLNGNLKPAQAYIHDLLEVIAQYEKTVPQPPAELADLIETVDLDYIRHDLPKLIGSMQEGIKRIANISDSLRTFSRSDTQTKVAFQVSEGIDSTIMILRHRLKANPHRPEIVIHRDYAQLPEIQCYPGQLNQVFMNLMANAIDALEEGNTDKTFADIAQQPNQITIRTRTLGDRIQICIADNGVGISQDIQAQIFDHLFTTKAVGQGTGLGLAISYQIITEKHTGSITVNSQIGAGTEFVIELPIVSE